MTDRIKTLLLDANGTHAVAVALDTIGQGRLTIRDAPKWLRASRLLRKAFGDRYADASYIADWRDAFCAHPRLAVEVCNITNLLEYHSCRWKIRTYDLVVVLHSAAGDRMGLLRRTAHWFHDRRGALAVFVGNEYDLMAQKIAFVNESGADFVCTQLPVGVAKQLYNGCGASVVPMPHALNPDVYRDCGNARSIDVGFVGDLYDRLIGDQERTRLVEFMASRGAAFGMRCDIRRERMPRADWAAYLNDCHGVVGAESGTYFLQPGGEALRCAKTCLRSDPDASFDAVFQRCFAHVQSALCGKAVSSRHFEPIGTHTCQLLIEGAYNGILEADRHYIAVARDLSNIEDAVGRFRDVSYRSIVTSTAYDHVMAAHTYHHRVSTLIETITHSRRGTSA